MRFRHVLLLALSGQQEANFSGELRMAIGQIGRDRAVTVDALVKAFALAEATNVQDNEAALQAKPCPQATPPGCCLDRPTGQVRIAVADDLRVGAELMIVDGLGDREDPLGQRSAKPLLPIHRFTDLPVRKKARGRFSVIDEIEQRLRTQKARHREEGRGMCDNTVDPVLHGVSCRGFRRPKVRALKIPVGCVPGPHRPSDDDVPPTIAEHQGLLQDNLGDAMAEAMNPAQQKHASLART